MNTPHPVYVHIGLPKTATTTFQRHLFENHSQIYYLGKFVGQGFVPAMAPILLNKVFKSKLESRFEPGDIHLQSLEKQLAHAAEKNLVTLLSKEGLAGGSLRNHKKQADLFKKNFGNCKIILFVREPESFIKSNYVQMLKAFQTRPPKGRQDWMTLLAKEPPHYFDINEWLSASWASSTSTKYTLSYADTAGIYADVFGRENIKIFIFEEFVRNSRGFTTQLCNHMGIDAEEGFRLIDGKRENEGKTTGYVELLQAIERSPELVREFRSSGSRKQSEMLTPVGNTGQKIAPVLTAEWLEKIHAVGDDQNRRLVNEWGLPLADYGYRL